MAKLLFALLFLALAGCAPRLQPSGTTQTTPALLENAWRAEDGAVMPLRSWQPEAPRQPQAVILALHGFNDYGNGFADPAAWWARERGIALYAPDQRGFGAAPYPGLWAGAERMQADLKELTRLLRKQHPGRPLFWLGESMGGAVLLAALAEPDNTNLPDGAILVGPAVWGRATMPLSYRVTLALSSHILPWLRLSGRGLGIQASDNIPMLRRYSADPLVIKQTRIDAVYGLVNLMDAALAAGPRLDPALPLLLLYGVNDQVIRKEPVERFAARLGGQRRIAVYDTGWHMLLRDLQAERVWRDIAAWINDPAAALPSGREATTQPLFPQEKN
ncbi:alpha/beta fold hydrolase [Ferrovibrio sp.]|uniref:alpha/beta fold hydrolase n=1 Tax=Ferrovibrio sp. TaxID=1917215 RepID=UPI001B5636A6|nr:alpha/beta fold hydrolase [Ferrovibrio sp.]MBP7065668.1 lysophospholipase [Ferrovibrio sp.]